VPEGVRAVKKRSRRARRRRSYFTPSRPMKEELHQVADHFEVSESFILRSLLFEFLREERRQKKEPPKWHP